MGLLMDYLMIWQRMKEVAGNHEYKEYKFCTVVSEVSSFMGNPMQDVNKDYLFFPKISLCHRKRKAQSPSEMVFPKIVLLEIVLLKIVLPKIVLLKIVLLEIVLPKIVLLEIVLLEIVLLEIAFTKFFCKHCLSKI